MLAAADLYGRLPMRMPPVVKRAPAFWAALLVATYCVQLAIVVSMARREAGPFPVVTFDAGHTLEVAALLACGAAQCYALLGVGRSYVSRTAIIAGAVAMVSLSLLVPALSNADLYAYVGDGLLGRAAYAPPSTPFDGTFAAVNAWWGAPIPPSTYGPLWLIIAHALVSASSNVTVALFAFRAFDAVALVALFALLRAYGVPPRLLAVAALNPALYFQFVFNAHNDMPALALVAAAALTASSRPAFASALIAVAAAIKAPYALAGLPVLARVVPASRRIAACVFAVAGAIAVSWFAGGLPYARALGAHVASSGLTSALHAAAALAAVVAIAAAVAGRRRLRGAVWLVPMIGAYTAAWYAVWSVPYALGSRVVLLYLLVSLPLVSILAEPSLTRPWTLLLLLPAIVVVSLVARPIRGSRGRAVRRKGTTPP